MPVPASLATMLVSTRSVAFQEVDAAGLVFFPHFLTYAHEAMERLFSSLEGGYEALIQQRRIGLPAVRVEVDYTAPLIYGETARIETSVVHLGNRSMVIRYRFVRERDGAPTALVRHTVVVTDLDRKQSCPMPDDVRRAAQAHLDEEQP